MIEGSERPIIRPVAQSLGCLTAVSNRNSVINDFLASIEKPEIKPELCISKPPE